MKTRHKIYIGNSRQMTEVADNSVSCVITSPHYVITLMKRGQEFDYGSYRDMIQARLLIKNENSTEMI